MKIVSINGSHNGMSGNTAKMVNAFLTGVRTTGAEIVDICLLDKEIKYCLACKACWFTHPGHCAIKDDMSEIISHIKKADILVLASPIYFDNISSMLKVFVDRLTVIGSPYWATDTNGECRHLTVIKPPKLILLANCGYPERSHFQVISHWINRVARNMDTEVIAELYASQGALLGSPNEVVRSVVDNFLAALQAAGRDIATNMQLSEDCKQILAQTFIPKEVYMQEVQLYIDNLIKEQHQSK